MSVQMSNTFWARSSGVSLLCCIAFSGCATRVADFTVLATRNVSISEMSVGPEAFGRDCVPVILVPFGQPSIEEAADRALLSAGAPYNMLVDVVVYARNKSFLFGSFCSEVRGTAATTEAQ